MVSLLGAAGKPFQAVGLVVLCVSTEQSPFQPPYMGLFLLARSFYWSQGGGGSLFPIHLHKINGAQKAKLQHCEQFLQIMQERQIHFPRDCVIRKAEGRGVEKIAFHQRHVWAKCAPSGDFSVLIFCPKVHTQHSDAFKRPLGWGLIK